MKFLIVPEENIVLLAIDYTGSFEKFDVDCSQFSTTHPDIVQVISDGKKIWCERDPFEGRDYDLDGIGYQTLIDVALDQKNAEIASQNTIEYIREMRLADINREYSSILNPFVKDYPDIEMKTWSLQEEEARGFLKDPQHPTPILNKILQGRNGDAGTETLTDLCNAVVRNSDEFKNVQYYTGYRQRLEKQIKAATTITEIKAIQWVAQ